MRRMTASHADYGMVSMMRGRPEDRLRALAMSLAILLTVHLFLTLFLDELLWAVR